MISKERFEELKLSASEEKLSWNDLIELEEAFNEIPEDQLKDARENALSQDMLDELETFIKGEENAVGEINTAQN